MSFDETYLEDMRRASIYIFVSFTFYGGNELTEKEEEGTFVEAPLSVVIGLALSLFMKIGLGFARSCNVIFLHRKFSVGNVACVYVSVYIYIYT